MPSGPSGALHTGGAWCADVCLCFVSKPGQAPPLPTGTAAGFSGPSGALHTCGAWCADVCLCFVSKPGQAPLPPTGAAAWPYGPSAGLLVLQSFWGVRLRVVTNVVNRRCFSCGFLIRCYKRRQSEGFFAENQGFWTQIDDVCNMSTRKGGSNCSGLTTFVTSAAHWSPGQALPPPTII